MIIITTSLTSSIQPPPQVSAVTPSVHPVTPSTSDADMVSPSPMSPRFFTFPSHPTALPPTSTALLNPMAEVTRLAVSPRALYPTSPIQYSRGSSKAVAHVKWNYSVSKRSFSDSDVAYGCLICGQAFPTNDNLAKHMAKHLPTETVRAGDNKVHYCKVIVIIVFIVVILIVIIIYIIISSIVFVTIIFLIIVFNMLIKYSTTAL